MLAAVSPCSADRLEFISNPSLVECNLPKHTRRSKRSEANSKVPARSLARIRDGASLSPPRTTVAHRATRRRIGVRPEESATSRRGMRRCLRFRYRTQRASYGDCFQLVLGRLQHRSGQIREDLPHLVIPALQMVVGNQADQERSLLQRVSRIVGLLREAVLPAPSRLAHCLFASLHHKVVGLAFPRLRTGGKFRRGLTELSARAPDHH